MSQGVSGDFKLSPKQLKRLEFVRECLKSGKNPYSKENLGDSIAPVPTAHHVVKHEMSLEDKMIKWLAHEDKHGALRPIHGKGSIPLTCVGCHVVLTDDISLLTEVKYLHGFRFGGTHYKTEKQAPFTSCHNTSYYPDYEIGYACDGCAKSDEVIIDKHGNHYPVVTVPDAPAQHVMVGADDNGDVRGYNDVKVHRTLDQIRDYQARNRKIDRENNVILEYDPNPALAKASIRRMENPE